MKKSVNKTVENEAIDALDLFKQELQLRRDGIKAILVYRDEVLEVERDWRAKRWELDAVIEAIEVHQINIMKPFDKISRRRK